MRLVYFCVAGSNPIESDTEFVRKLVDSMPPRFRFRTGNNDASILLMYSDRISPQWHAEFYDAAIFFVSRLFLDNSQSMQNLEHAFRNLSTVLCVDLYGHLTPEMLERLGRLSQKIIPLQKAAEYLEQLYPPTVAEVQAEERKEILENDGFKYLDDTISTLTAKAKSNRVIAVLSYIGAVLALIPLLIISFRKPFPSMANNSLSTTIQTALAFVGISAFTVSLSRILFLLGKSFMVESIRHHDRVHAIGFGKLYLQLYKNEFKWDELKDVLQNWNIDKGSAFIGLDAKDIEALGVEKLMGLLRKE